MWILYEPKNEENNNKAEKKTGKQRSYQATPTTVEQVFFLMENVAGVDDSVGSLA